MLGADVSTLQRSLDLGAKYYDASGTAGRPARHPQARGRQLRPAARLEQPGQRLQQQGQGAAAGQGGQGQGPEAADRLPLLGHLGRPGQAVQARRLGRRTRSASCRPTSTTTRTTSAPASRRRAPPRTACRSATRSTSACCGTSGKVVNNDFTQPRACCSSGLQRDQGVQQRHPGDHPHRRRGQRRQRPLVLRRHQGHRASAGTSPALSYYCMWHGTLANLYNVITDVRSRYGKPVVIAETAYPFTTGQRRQHRQLDPRHRAAATAIRATWAGQAAAVHRRAEHRPQRRRDRRLLLGADLVRRSRATAGTRPTSTAPATAGTTWPSSTGPAT